MMITPDDLPLLVHTLNRHFNGHSDRSTIGSLRLCLLNPTNPSIQSGSGNLPLLNRQISERSLLGPFWNLCLNKKATITGATDKAYAKEIRTRMSKRPCGAERWLERARTKLAEGDQFLNSGSLQDAIEAYDSSILSSRTVRTTENEAIITYIQLCQKTAYAHLCLDNYMQALDYTDIALRAMEDAECHTDVQEQTRTVEFFCQRELASCEAKFEIPVHMNEIGVRQYWTGDLPEDQRKRNAFLMWMNELKAGDKVMQKTILRYLVFRADAGDDALNVQWAVARASGKIKELNGAM